MQITIGPRIGLILDHCLNGSSVGRTVEPLTWCQLLTLSPKEEQLVVGTTSNQT